MLNVKIDLKDISSVVESISNTLSDLKDSIHYPDNKEYYDQLKGALYALKSAIETEILRYDSNSYEVYIMNGVVSRIEGILKEAK